MSDTSKEAVALIVGELRDGGLFDPTRHQAADLIEALAAERDAATERAEKAEFFNAVKEDEITALRMKLERAIRLDQSALVGIRSLYIDGGSGSVVGSLEAERDALRARVAALEGALRKAAEAFRWYESLHAAKTPSDTDKAKRIADFAEMCEAALSALPTPAVSQAAADVLAAVRKLGAKDPGWKSGDDDECMGEGDGELGLAAALYLLPYEATVGGEKLLKQDDFIRLDMILELTCGWSLKPIIDRRERLVQGVAFGLAEIERLDRTTQHDEPERCIACDKPFKPGDLYHPDKDGGSIHAECGGPERESYTNADGDPLGPDDPIPEPRAWHDEREG